MNSKHKFLFLVPFFIVIFASCSGDNFSRRLTAEAEGEITSVVLDRERKTTRRRSGSSNRRRTTTKTTYETDISYRYNVNGQTYNGETEKDGDVTGSFRSGSRVQVCYNPAQPDESDVFENGHRCGS
jgi:hypothetical protein